ncbi:MAG TPA: aldo/keto reductase [Bryobacteraceae bacterium]|nr:aldo/keto reductase [Bryobacteraceae bacterium]
MQYQQLGNTGVFVSRLCLGAMTFGGKGGIFEVIGGLPQHDVDTLVGNSLDAGVNFIDTANIYSYGESETMLGKALGTKRKEVVVATKVFGRMGKGANQVGLSRLHIMQEVEASLDRLNTDYIDLYQIHGFDSVTPLEETLSAMTDLVRQGKVRYIGCSNLAAWQIMKALGISGAKHLEKFITLQAYYSLVGRELERELIPMMLDQKIGLLVWSPLAGGFLSGKFTRAGASDNAARRAKFTFPPVNLEQGYNIVDTLMAVGARRNATVAQVALAWLLNQPSVSSVIIGARNATQLKDNLGSVDVQLDAEDLKQIDEASKLAPEYPNWMLGTQGSDRKPGQVRDWSRFMAASK